MPFKLYPSTVLVSLCSVLSLSALGCSSENSPADGSMGGGAAQMGQGTGASGNGAQTGTGGNSTGALGENVTDEDGCVSASFHLRELEASAGKYTLIAGDGSFIHGVEADGTDVYLIADSGLFKISGESTTLAVVSDDVGDIGNTWNGSRLAIHEGYAYLATTTGVSRVSLSGGSAEVFFDGMPEGAPTNGIQISGDSIYVASRTPTYVYRVPLDGSDATLLNDSLSLQDFAVSGDNVFVSDFTTGVVQTFPITGGAPTPAALGQSNSWVIGVAAEGDDLYWVASGLLKTSLISDPSMVTAIGEAEEGNLEVVGDRIYSNEDHLKWISKDGLTCGTVALGTFPSNVREYAIAGGYAFVTDSDDIYRVPLN